MRVLFGIFLLWLFGIVISIIETVGRNWRWNYVGKEYSGEFVISTWSRNEETKEVKFLNTEFEKLCSWVAVE